MTWETGDAAKAVIKRLAEQLAANLPHGVSGDEVLRRCVGMALSQDLTDDELQALVGAVDSLRDLPAVPSCRGAIQGP